MAQVIKNFIIFIILGIIIIIPANIIAQESFKKRPEIAAVYYPHWHKYDHGIAWKGEGWTEWVEMNAATPRFPGHQQPKRSLLGNFDESDPKCVEKEISLAADHGIDVFLYCWYWYSGVKNMEEALENGFLHASNRNRMKFALMWANHDRTDSFYPEYGKPKTTWLPSHHSPRDLIRVIDYCISHYFREPNYWRINDSLFFSVYESEKFVNQLGGPDETRKLFREVDSRLQKASLPPMHWSAMASTPEKALFFKRAGFSSTSLYNINVYSLPREKMMPDFTFRYEDIMDAHLKIWESMTKASPLVNLPVVSMGWDPTPRCRQDFPWPYPSFDYPYTPVVVGNTPGRYEQLLRNAALHVQNDPQKPFGILLNAWNEWTEGSYLLPEERTGTLYLEAIRKVFGVGEKANSNLQEKKSKQKP